MRKPSLLVIFLTVFIDLIGFGIVLPLLPIYSRNFEAQGITIGAIMASYSVMQFLFAPFWGRLSDRIGRKPVLLVSTAGAAISYAVFALGSAERGATGLVILLGSRLLAGICGANITVAQAYIADITEPQERSRRMGLIGMAFGLGFVFGPGIGGVSIKLFGVAGPGWVAASLCAANFFLTLVILGESWQPGATPVTARPQLAQWGHTLAQPKIGLLIGVFFLATFCFASFETTLGLLISENFRLDTERLQDATTSGYLFAYCGIVGALVQGGLIGRLVRKMGEPKLIVISLVIFGMSLAPLPFIKGDTPLHWRVLINPGGVPWLGLLLFLGLLSIGSSLTRPPIFGLISNLTPAHEQGATLGVAQSAGSLARIIGPVAAGAFYQFRPAAPYVFSAIVSLVTAFVAWQYLCRAPIPIGASAPAEN
ncbi:MAG: MFS transporter [Verrucomicrobia subdivision 3 bacterium]|nr:MFS transporter [Limisphaerales bacterium]